MDREMFEQLMGSFAQFQLDFHDNIQNFTNIKDFENDFTRAVKTITSDFENPIKLNGSFEPKSRSKAIELRNEGNKQFTKSKRLSEFIIACILYSKSIAYANFGSEELALAYANRSSVLFHLELYEQCLSDINRALLFDYPDQLIEKLYIRKIRCMSILHKKNTKIVYQDILNVLDTFSKDHQETKKKLKKALEEPSDFYDVHKETQEFLGNALKRFRSEAPNLSKVKVLNDAKKGRHLVAAKNIKVGEIVAVQKMYTRVLEYDKAYYVCWQCLSMCLNMIPCPRCVMAMFCSEECRGEAEREHHGVECGVLYCASTGPSFRSALRISVLATHRAGNIEQLMKMARKMSMKEDLAEECPIENNELPYDKYENVYKMVIKKPSLKDYNYMGMCKSVVHMVYCLATETTFFREKFPMDYSVILENKSVVFFGGLLLKHLIICRALPAYQIYNGKRSMVGLIVCPLHSYLNHSCNPNVYHIMIKDSMIFFALRPIKKGEEITLSYVDRNALLLPRNKRHKHLEFTCKCDMCVKKINNKRVSFKTIVKDDKKRCILNAAHMKMMEIAQFFLPSTPYDEEEFFVKARELFHYAQGFYEFAPPYCHEVFQFQSFLSDSFSELNNPFFVNRPGLYDCEHSIHG